MWKCVCNCCKHKIVYTSAHKLKSGGIKSCGCLQKEKVIEKNKRRKLDLTGQRFGMLVAIEIDNDKTKSKKETYWKCRCDCGRYVSVSLRELRRDFYGNNTRHGTKSCGCSSKSVGENRIKEILNKLKINYEREKTFFDLKNPKTNCCLRFDFYLPNYNVCIEYDGYPHFFTNGGWNTEENLAKIKYRDEIKNKYCLNKKIRLIRIPYTDYKKLNEEYILKRLEIDG